MKFSRILKFFRKKEKKAEYQGVADFFLRASDEEKIAVIGKAAREANQLQMDIHKRAQQVMHQRN